MHTADRVGVPEKLNVEGGYKFLFQKWSTPDAWAAAAAKLCRILFLTYVQKQSIHRQK